MSETGFMFGPWFPELPGDKVIHRKQMSRKEIEEMVKRNITEAAFKYRKNAELFTRLWERRGYKVSWGKSYGPVVDIQGAMIEADRNHSSIYCVARPPKARKRRREQTPFEQTDEALGGMSNVMMGGMGLMVGLGIAGSMMNAFGNAK